MLYIDDFYKYSTKMAHTDNGDRALTMITDVTSSQRENMGIFCVTDGVSSANPELSSKLAMSAIRKHLTPLLTDVDALAEISEEKRTAYFFRVMKDAILSANELLVKNENICACTVSMCIVYDDFAYVANVGDSPIYLWDSGSDELSEIYTCQNEAGTLVAQGLMTKEEARTSKLKNHLLKGLGSKKNPLEPTDIATTKVFIPQDCILLLGSDGSLGMFTEEEIKVHLRSNTENMKALCNSIFDDVVRKEGKDDSTLIAAHLNIGI